MRLRPPPGARPAGALAGLTKRDVQRGDVGAVVVALDWPSAREGAPRPAAAAAAALAARSGGRPGAARARHAWALACAYARFRTARRRQLLEAWWAAADGAVRAAEAAARVAEVAAWRTLGQAVQVCVWGGCCRE